MIGASPLLPSQPLALPGRKTASGGLATVPRLRAGRWRPQAHDAPGKIRPGYDRARRRSHLQQSGKRSGRKTCDGVPGFAQFETAAQIAISANPVNSYTPAWLRGIFIHSAFSATVRNFSSTSVNVSYKDGGVAGWLDLGSVRPDAVYGDVNSPNFIIELKTGNARLENPQLSNYYNNLPTNTKICEIFENGG